MVVVMFAATSFVFFLSRAAGDPRDLYLSQYTTKEEWDAWGKEMGLDKVLITQYFIWLGRAVQGDFGKSIRDQIDAKKVIVQRIPATLQLATGAFLFSIALGVPLGVLSALKRGTVWDYMGRTFALFGQALPAFWVGIVLILIFAVHFEWLPTGRRGGWDHFILPSITLGWSSAAAIVRLVRSSMLDVLGSEYVRFARAKGVTSRSVVWKHALRNAFIPTLTYTGILLAAFLTGTVVTETVFAWPGLGRLAIQAVFNNDFPVITGAVLLFTFVYLGINFLVDLSYVFLDPRIRYA